MFVVGHPNANANVRQALLALDEAGALGEFHTGLDTTKHLRLVPRAFRAEFERRAFSPAIAPRIVQHPAGEIVRLARERSSHFRPKPGSRWSIDGRYRAIDSAIARRLRSGQYSGVYGYEDGAAAAFAVAARLGISRVYDLPIGYWRASHRILGEEADRRPQWASTLTGLRDSPQKLERKDEELASANRIIVASSFTRQTLSESPHRALSIDVVPYGAPAPSFAERNVNPKGPLRVLFVGVLSQRKGLADLLDAVNLLERDCELTIVGRARGDLSEEATRSLASVRHIESLPPAGVLAEMRRHHVLVLPSLFEGFGLVLTEALSQGTPIIATTHTAAPDLIARSNTQVPPGWVVPIRSPEAISTILEELASSPDLREEASSSAYALAHELSWRNYRNGLAEALGLRRDVT